MKEEEEGWGGLCRVEVGGGGGGVETISSLMPGSPHFPQFFTPLLLPSPFTPIQTQANLLIPTARIK